MRPGSRKEQQKPLGHALQNHTLSRLLELESVKTLSEIPGKRFDRLRVNWEAAEKAGKEAPVGACNRETAQKRTWRTRTIEKIGKKK